MTLPSVIPADPSALAGFTITGKRRPDRPRGMDGYRRNAGVGMPKENRMRFVSALLLHTVKGRGLFPVYGRPRSSRNAAPCDSFWAEFIGHSLKLNTTSAPKARSDEARAAGSLPKVKGWVTCPEAT